MAWLHIRLIYVWAELALAYVKDPKMSRPPMPLGLLLLLLLLRVPHRELLLVADVVGLVKQPQVAVHIHELLSTGNVQAAQPRPLVPSKCSGPLPLRFVPVVAMVADWLHGANSETCEF